MSKSMILMFAIETLCHDCFVSWYFLLWCIENIMRSSLSFDYNSKMVI